jgi:hypothetical protein
LKQVRPIVNNLNTLVQPFYITDATLFQIFKMYVDGGTGQTRLDMIEGATANPPSIRMFYDNAGHVGNEIMSDPAGAGLILDSYKNVGAGGTSGMVIRTVNAAGNLPIQRILIQGGVAEGAGGVQFQDPITKWDVGNARVGFHINANGAMDFINGCNAGTFAHIAAVFVKAGVPSDADFALPFNGLIVVDTSTPKLWLRTAAATWKGVAIA